MSDMAKAVIGGIVIGILATFCIWWFVMEVSAAPPEDIATAAAEPSPEPEPGSEYEPQSTPGGYDHILEYEPLPELEPLPDYEPYENEPIEYDGPSSDFGAFAAEDAEQTEESEEKEPAQDEEYKGFVAVSFGTVLGGISGLAITNKWNVG
jgi:hypothetical protein